MLLIHKDKEHEGRNTEKRIQQIFGRYKVDKLIVADLELVTPIHLIHFT